MSKEKINPLELTLTRVCFTNDKSMFCICHDQGFLVCKSDPFAILNNRILGGEISFAQMLDTSNIIFLASGGGEKPKYPLTHVIMFDDHKGKPVAQLQVGHRIKNIKANSKRLFVVGKNKIFVFKTEDLSNVGTFESYEDDHNKKIACIELNKKGDRLLSSSIGGTLIRLFDTNTGDILDDFKRGNDKAQIYSLCFSSDDKFICCSSDKGTIHIFKRNEYDEEEINEFNTVTKKFGKDILEKTIVNRQQATNITKSRKFAFCRTNEETSFCVFNEKDEINLVSVNDEGKFIKIIFDKNKGGETNIEHAFKILCQENLPHLKP